MIHDLVLCDLDLTLIDKEYHPTVPLDFLWAKVAVLELAGHAFGLVSDTAYQTLRDWMETFHLHGPVVSEKGVLVTLPSGQQIKTLEQAIDWPILKKSVLEAVQQVYPEAPIVFRHYLDLMADSSSLPQGITEVVIVNPYRQNSISFHVLKVGSNRRLIRDLDVYNPARSAVLQKLESLGMVDQLDIDANATYSIVILADKRVDKTCAMPILRQHYPGHRIIMIGDSAGDAVLKGHVDVLCAVGNATPEMKAAADIVAKAKITEGVIEILNKLY